MKGESNSTEFYMELLSLKIGCCSYNNSYASPLVATKKRPRVDMKKVKKKIKVHHYKKHQITKENSKRKKGKNNFKKTENSEQKWYTKSLTINNYFKYI